jgi:hypothetical protein
MGFHSDVMSCDLLGRSAMLICNALSALSDTIPAIITTSQVAEELSLLKGLIVRKT